MDYSTAGFPVLHNFPQLVQTHVHWVSDAIQPSHPLSSPSPPVFNLSQHWVFSNVLAFHIKWPKYWALVSASVLLMNIQDWFPLRVTDLISFLSKGHSWVFSSTTVQNHQFSGAQSSLWSKSHMHTWLLEKPIRTFVGKVMSLLFNMLSRFVKQLSSN